MCHKSNNSHIRKLTQFNLFFYYQSSVPQLYKVSEKTTYFKDKNSAVF